MHRFGLGLASVLLALSACVLDAAPGGRPACDDGCGGPDDREGVAFEHCDREPGPVAKATGSFRHTSSWLASFATAWHAGHDAIAVVGVDAVLRAEFTYGSLGKELEDEWIEVWVDRCGELERVAQVKTDDEGQLALVLPADHGVEVGRHAVHFRVVGDGTTTSSTLTVLPPSSHLAVFDIDGTLTTSDWELFEDLFDDLFNPIRHGRAPDARAGAADTTWARADQGYVPVFLTGRPSWLTTRTRQWLADRGMAEGVLITASGTWDIVPTQGGVGTFKAETLAALQLLGLEIDVAYGNASTDVFAYSEAGIEPASTFILGRHGGEAGTVALGEDYRAHLGQVEFGVIEQPFVRGD